MSQYEPAAHYDRVTRAWHYLLGDELHYGVFDTGAEALPDATAALTQRMVEAADLRAGARVLDVGCGTGTQACALAARHGVEVLGITTSEVGAAVATARAQASGLQDQVRFEVRDGTHNGLPAESYDRVWVLESSHLMPERGALIAECARVLRPGGRLALCDIVRKRTIPFMEVRSRVAEFAVLRAAFGVARMDTMAEYVELCAAVGLVVDGHDDLTSETLPTFDRWLENADRHEASVIEAIGADDLHSFRQASEVLRQLWIEGILGYGLLSATKPSGTPGPLT